MSTLSVLVSMILFLLSSINVIDAYYLAWHGLEWNNASIWCQSYCGSHLASVHSAFDHLEMIKLIDNLYPYIYTRTWIGLNDIDKTDVWVWSDKTPFDFGNVKATNSHLILRGSYPWRSNEPDYNDSIDTCVAIETGSNYPTSNSERWVDRRMTANYQFFCNSCSSKLHKYAAVNGDRNQTRAQKICEDTFGTSLASIHSNSDMLEARTTCKQITGSNGCWIGLSDLGGTQQFKWEDGTEWDYGRTLHAYPWYESEPGASVDQHCIFLDPSNGADPGEYLWDDFWCNRESPKALCNAPSEICMDQQWFIPTGNPNDWIFSKRPCELTKNVMEPESVAIIGDKQYVNTAGTLLVDMMYTISSVGKNGNAGVAFYQDQTTCKDWFYVGIWADFNILFIGKSVNGIWNLLDYKSLTAHGITYTKGTYYNLGIELSGGTSWIVKLNDQQILAATDPDPSANVGNTKSGFVAIREVNATFTVKSLFISGEVEYYINNEWYMSCTASPTFAPTVETISPSLNPTTDPSISPTFDPTLQPSNPTTEPTNDPTLEPTVPSGEPTVNPTTEPTGNPTEVPTVDPTIYPTLTPTKPTAEPSNYPSTDPSKAPSTDPTASPTLEPTSAPSDRVISVVVEPDGDNAAAQQGRTQLIWIVGIPIGLALMCGFFVFMYKTWKEEEELEKAKKDAANGPKSPKSGKMSVSFAKHKASMHSMGSGGGHVRSPSNSLEMDDDDMDEIEMGVTVTGIDRDPLDDDDIMNDEVELEIDDGNDAYKAPAALPMNTDDMDDDENVLPQDDVNVAKKDITNGPVLEEVLEEVTMVPSKDGAMVPDTHDHEDYGEDATSRESSATPNLTTPLKKPISE